MVYVGQAYGPFWLPCHKKSGFDENGRCPVDPKIAQCAGAAIYRANTERTAAMPPGIHALPPSDLAFRSPVELVMHHYGVGRTVAEAMLATTPPPLLLQMEMQKLTVRRVPMEKLDAEAKDA